MVSPYHYKAAFIKWWSHIHRYVLIASCGDGFSKWYKGKTFLIQSMVVPLAAWAMFFSYTPLSLRTRPAPTTSFPINPSPPPPHPARTNMTVPFCPRTR